MKSSYLGLGIDIREPQTERDFEEYYRLRWEVLRAPWNQPLGSERDEWDKNSIHLMAWANGTVLGTGRIFFFEDGSAQVGFMAVSEKARNQGVGSQILQELVARAAKRGTERLIVNGRDSALRFYQRHGFKTCRAGKTLFGSIPHSIMEKSL